MTDYAHFSQHESISAAILGFAEQARGNGLNVGIAETIDALEAANCGLLENPPAFRHALKAIFCTSQEDLQVFDELFDWFWGKEKAALKSKTTLKNQSNLPKKSKGSLVMLGQGKQDDDGEESKNTSGANQAERLRKTDFSKISELESPLLEELAMKLWRQMSLRLKRKMKASKTKGRLDLRRTIRRSIGHGGEPIELRKKRRKPQKQRLVLLLDVSGSMDKYSFFLLRFIVALRAHFEKMEAFVFSTRLVCITEFLAAKNLETILAALSAKADAWSGGTRIGDCLADFNEHFAKRTLNRRSTVLVLSDGLDTGEPALLAAELRKMRLRTRRLIWLNPLKGMKDYQPVQRGMSAALPEIDLFRPAHNLDSLLELEDFLVAI